MKKLFTAVVVVVGVGVVGAAITAYASKKKLQDMTDDEIRAYLAAKLENKVSDEQLSAIQDSVIAGVRKTNKVVEAVEDAVADAAKGVSDMAEAAKGATSDVVEDVADAAADATDDVVEDLTSTTE
jgi:hypothetical protein